MEYNIFPVFNIGSQLFEYTDCRLFRACIALNRLHHCSSIYIFIDSIPATTFLNQMIHETAIAEGIAITVLFGYLHSDIITKNKE